MCVCVCCVVGNFDGGWRSKPIFYKTIFLTVCYLFVFVCIAQNTVFRIQYSKYRKQINKPKKGKIVFKCMTKYYEMFKNLVENLTGNWLEKLVRNWVEHLVEN